MDMKGYINSYEYSRENDSLVTVYTFSLEEYRDDIEKIIEGKYSELSPESKLKITKFWRTYSDNSIVLTIFNRPNDMKFYWSKRDIDPEDYCSPGEAWYKPDLEDETYTFVKEV